MLTTSPHQNVDAGVQGEEEVLAVGVVDPEDVGEVDQVVVVGVDQEAGVSVEVSGEAIEGGGDSVVVLGADVDEGDSVAVDHSTLQHRSILARIVLLYVVTSCVVPPFHSKHSHTFCDTKNRALTI